MAELLPVPCLLTETQGLGVTGVLAAAAFACFDIEQINQFYKQQKAKRREVHLTFITMNSNSTLSFH